MTKDSEIVVSLHNGSSRVAQHYSFGAVAKTMWNGYNMTGGVSGKVQKMSMA